MSQWPTSENKWQETLNFSINEEMWKLIYTNDKYVTEDTDIRNFQFKITHRLLACNYNLHIWKDKTQNTCDYCQEIDTIEHFLVNCDNTYNFWRQIFNWWAASLKVWFQVDMYKLLFGEPNKRNEPIVNQINFIILTASIIFAKTNKRIRY